MVSVSVLHSVRRQQNADLMCFFLDDPSWMRVQNRGKDVPPKQKIEYLSTNEANCIFFK